MGGYVFSHSKEDARKNTLITLRFEAKASQMEKIKIVSLRIDIKDPIEEIIFHDKKLSG